MDFRSVIPLAPLPLRPILQALLAWMERTDRRLDELELRAQRNQL